MLYWQGHVKILFFVAQRDHVLVQKKEHCDTQPQSRRNANICRSKAAILPLNARASVFDHVHGVFAMFEFML